MLNVKVNVAVYVNVGAGPVVMANKLHKLNVRKTARKIKATRNQQVVSWK